MTYTELITDALTELRVARAGDVISPEDAALGLLRLNRLFDDWNADGDSPWTVLFSTFTLTPNLSPHTIGPSGATFTVSNIRPVEILGANLIFSTTSPNVYTPITIRDWQWWQNERVPTLANAVPTDLYYDPAWTLGTATSSGSLYFWPVPNVAYQVQLWMRVTWAQVALTDTVALPPGGRSALTLTLAEELAASFNQPAPTMAAAKARARFFGQNISVPRIATADFGMQGPAGNKGTWSFWTGMFRNPGQ